MPQSTTIGKKERNQKQTTSIESLIKKFEDLDQVRQQIFWLYFVHSKSDGDIGCDPKCPGRVEDWSACEWIQQKTKTFYTFRNRACRIVLLVNEFIDAGIDPPSKYLPHKQIAPNFPFYTLASVIEVDNSAEEPDKKEQAPLEEEPPKKESRYSSPPPRPTIQRNNLLHKEGENMTDFFPADLALPILKGTSTELDTSEWPYKRIVVNCRVVLLFSGLDQNVSREWRNGHKELIITVRWPQFMTNPYQMLQMFHSGMANGGGFANAFQNMFTQLELDAARRVNNNGFIEERFILHYDKPQRETFYARPELGLTGMDTILIDLPNGGVGHILSIMSVDREDTPIRKQDAGSIRARLQLVGHPGPGAGGPPPGVGYGGGFPAAGLGGNQQHHNQQHHNQQHHNQHQNQHHYPPYGSPQPVASGAPISGSHHYNHQQQYQTMNQFVAPPVQQNQATNNYHTPNRHTQNNPNNYHNSHNFPSQNYVPGAAQAQQNFASPSFGSPPPAPQQNFTSPQFGSPPYNPAPAPAQNQTQPDANYYPAPAPAQNQTQPDVNYYSAPAPAPAPRQTQPDDDDTNMPPPNLTPSKRMRVPTPTLMSYARSPASAANSRRHPTGNLNRTPGIPSNVYLDDNRTRIQVETATNDDISQAMSAMLSIGGTTNLRQNRQQQPVTQPANQPATPAGESFTTPRQSPHHREGVTVSEEDSVVHVA